jgi:AmmeMemoRadiSam system protein A
MMSDETGTQGELNKRQQQILLKLARDTITQWVTSRTLPELPTGEPIFEEPRAVFVTLHKHGQLRGCIGTLEPREPLAAAVRSAAISAATQDPRFPPVTAAEIPELEIEISVLSPLRRVESADEIEVGKHGVVVAAGMRRGVFLPQVPIEQGWDRETMLNYLCLHKAGLPADAWRRGAELWVFTTQVFSEAD